MAFYTERTYGPNDLTTQEITFIKQLSLDAAYDANNIPLVSGMPTAGQIAVWGPNNTLTGVTLNTAPNFSDNETPFGTINGSNDTFTLAHAPNPAMSLILILNGQVQTQGVEYTLSGATITFAFPLPAEFAGVPFKAFYRY
jgi:hypothetical protein